MLVWWCCSRCSRERSDATADVSKLCGHRKLEQQPSDRLGPAALTITWFIAVVVELALPLLVLLTLFEVEERRHGRGVAVTVRA